MGEGVGIGFYLPLVQFVQRPAGVGDQLQGVSVHMLAGLVLLAVIWSLDISPQSSLSMMMYPAKPVLPLLQNRVTSACFCKKKFYCCAAEDFLSCIVFSCFCIQMQRQIKQAMWLTKPKIFICRHK